MGSEKYVTHSQCVVRILDERKETEKITNTLYLGWLEYCKYFNELSLKYLQYSSHQCKYCKLQRFSRLIDQYLHQHIKHKPKPDSLPPAIIVLHAQMIFTQAASTLCWSSFTFYQDWIHLILSKVWGQVVLRWIGYSWVCHKSLMTGSLKVNWILLILSKFGDR